MSQMIRELKNDPPDKILSIIGAIVIVFFIILAVLAYDSDWPWTTLIMIIPILGGGLAIWNGEYFRRPKCVEVREGGAYLTFRYSKPRFIPYETMLAINSREGNPATMLGRWDRGGYLEMKHQFTPYSLSYEIAEQMRESYRNKMGRYPPKVGT